MTGRDYEAPQPPQRVAVLQSWASPKALEEATVRGRVVHVATDDRGLTWAWYLPDEHAQPVTLHGYEDGYWPVPGDRYLRSLDDVLLVAEGTHLRLVKAVIHIYTRSVPSAPSEDRP